MCIDLARITVVKGNTRHISYIHYTNDVETCVMGAVRSLITLVLYVSHAPANL